MIVDWAPKDQDKRYEVLLDPGEPAPSMRTVVDFAETFLQTQRDRVGVPVEDEALAARAIINAQWFLDHAKPVLAITERTADPLPASLIVHDGHEPSGMRRRHITVDDHLLTVTVNRDAQAAFARWLEQHREELRGVLGVHGVDVDLLLQPTLERYLSDGDVAVLAGR